MAETKITTNKSGGKYKYADLGQIHEWLEENKITYYQYVQTEGGVDFIYTVPCVDGKELPARRGCRIVEAKLVGVSNPAQEQGSAITYARRYSLLMAFGLCTEDNDAQNLSRPKKEAPKQEDAFHQPMLITFEQKEDLKKELDRTGVTEEMICETCKVDSIDKITAEAYKAVMNKLSITPAKKE